MDYIGEHIQCAEGIPEFVLRDISKIIINSLKTGGTVYTCGNGGSASDALHLTAEFVGRFEKDRPALNSVCLNANVSNLTAIANDYGYEEVFARQLQTCKQNDVVIGFTTSGNSKNVVKGLEQAKKNGATTVCFIGLNPSALVLPFSDKIIGIHSRRTSIVQECHIIAIHMLAKMVEDGYFTEPQD